MLAASPNPVKGISLKIASVIAFMAMSALIKAAGQVPAGEITFFRSFFAVFPILAWLAWTGTLRSAFVTHDLFGHVWRALVGVAAMTCFFFAITRLPLPEVTALGFASPLFVVVLSAVFLRETVRWYRWSAVLAGLVGVTIIGWPRFTAFDGNWTGDATLGAAATLAGAFLAACAMLFVRRLVKTEQTQTIVLYFSLIASAVALLSAPFGWIVLSPMQAALLVSAGCVGGVAQILMTEGYRHTEASVLAPFEYVSMLVAIIIGYVAFDEVPTAYTLAGSAIVIAAGVFIIWRERQLGLQRGPIKPVAHPQD
ncbi:MAG: DMT family transporter [Rhizobiaceae bacterium]|nr:DMT family transporter [Rhizobiaceae bacterium]